tara:strand:+ start:3001 stop:3297 length:297 start_codon:yes stop_codon:yes gene_type:complete
MAGNFKRGRGKAPAPKLIGRGVLESVETEGPFNEWVGMPPYYMHQLNIEGEFYSYLSGDKDLEIEPGKKVTFRYKIFKEKKMIDKRSLGVVIDPSELV